MSAPSPSYAVRVGLARAQLEPCLLCGADEIAGVAIFVPDHPGEYGAPEGKQRYIFYALCGRCTNSDCPAEAVENELAARVRETAA